MTTEYYALREPITRIGTTFDKDGVDFSDDDGQHEYFNIKVGSEVIGHFECPAKHYHDIIFMFADTDHRLARVTGGPNGTMGMSESGYPYSGDTQIISEYGELTTLGELRKKVEESQQAKAPHLPNVV